MISEKLEIVGLGRVLRESKFLSAFLPRRVVTTVLEAAVMISLIAGSAGAATAFVETVAMNGTGDIADDMCVWIHPADKTKSIIIGVNKSDNLNAGLYTFNVNGGRSDGGADWVVGTNQFDEGEKLNNVDVHYNFEAGDEKWDIVCSSSRSSRTIEVLRITTNAAGDFTGMDRVGKIDIGTGFAAGPNAPYGMAIYYCRSNGKHYVFISDKEGNVAEFELTHNPGGSGTDRVLGTRYDDGGSPWDISGDGTEVEGIVADDRRDVVYIAAEDHGIYRYAITNGIININDRVVVDVTGGGRLTADIEGMTMYNAPEGAGYLIASSQGNSSFAVYKREYTGSDTNEYIMNFTILGGGGVGNVEDTDGIDVVNANLGGSFTNGMFLAHDSLGENPSNYKIVDWADIADDGGQNLTIDTTWDPRDPDTDDDGMLDDWERKHFDGLSRDGTGDKDNDKLCDLHEFLAGTDPTNNLSVLAFARIVMGAQSEVIIQWHSVSGKFYNVERSTNLLLTGFDDELTNHMPDTTPVNIYTDAVGGVGSFYRVSIDQE